MRVISFLILIYITIINTTQFSNYNGNFVSSIYKAGKGKSVVRNGEQNYLFEKPKKYVKNGNKDKLELLKALGMGNDQNSKLDNQFPKNSAPRYNRRSNYDGRRKDTDSDSSDSSSSSLEMKNWKDEWREHWLKKKLEAINSSVPKGDMVNMVAARPWGVPCGDPNQHDAPWGSCMLPMECEPEYRIYRGDYFCGRTKFICCALQLTNYDLYAGFDVSFADSDLDTDSDEKKSRERSSKERKRRRKRRDRKRRLRERNKRKRKIKKTIRRIVREIRKILNRSFRNGTTARKRKTKQLKKFIEDMKKQYIKERKAVQDIHEKELIKIDAALQKRLNEIKAMNQQYIKNVTFRDIVVNGTISKQNARMLLAAYPELADMLDTRRRGSRKPKDYLDYDIEYGYLYY